MNTHNKASPAWILHCTAKIPRTAGSMPPSVSMNLNKWKFRAGWFPLQYSTSCLQCASAKCLSDTNKARRHWVTTQHILDSVRGVSGDGLRDRARDRDTKLLWHALPPVSDHWSPLSRCHAALSWLTDAVPPSDWPVMPPSRPLIGHMVSDHSLMIVISWVTFGHQVIPDRSQSPDYPVSEEDQSREPLSRTHHTPILELNWKPDTKLCSLGNKHRVKP